MFRRIAALGFAAILCASLSSAADQQVQEEGSPARLTTLGNNALARSQYESAISKYEQALKADPGYFYALFNLGLAHQRLGELTTDPTEATRRFNLAKSQYEEALRRRPDNPETLCNLGIVAFRLGFHSQSLKFFQTALERSSDPQEAASYAFSLGRTYEALGEWHKARDAYRTCLERDRNHFGGHYNLGTLYLEHLDTPRLADEHLQAARTIDPHRPEPLINLAVLAERSGQAEAEALYSEAVRVAEAHYDRLLDTALWHRSRYYHRTSSASLGGRPAKRLMMADLQRILSRSPDFPGANGLLGAYYESLADYPKAIMYLEREVEGKNFDPTNEIDLQCHYLLAVIYSDHSRNPTKALHHATEYYRVNEDALGKALHRRALRLSGEQTNDGRTTAPDTPTEGGTPEPPPKTSEPAPKPAASEGAKSPPGSLKGHGPETPTAKPAPAAAPTRPAHGE